MLKNKKKITPAWVTAISTAILAIPVVLTLLGRCTKDNPVMQNEIVIDKKIPLSKPEVKAYPPSDSKSEQ